MRLRAVLTSIAMPLWRYSCEGDIVEVDAGAPYHIT